MDLWPNKRRVEYIVLQEQKGELKNNLKYLKYLGKYMMEPNVVKMTKTIREYMHTEKAQAIAILKTR